MTNITCDLDNLFLFEEIFRGFLKDRKMSSYYFGNKYHHPFQIDFEIDYRPSKEEEILEETVSLFLVNSNTKRGQVRLQTKDHKNGIVNGKHNWNHEYDQWCVTGVQVRECSTFKERLKFSQWFVESGLSFHHYLRISEFVNVRAIEPVGFIEPFVTFPEREVA
jgi:hypothetical protein